MEKTRAAPAGCEIQVMGGYLIADCFFPLAPVSSINQKKNKAAGNQEPKNGLMENSNKPEAVSVTAEKSAIGPPK